MKREYENSFQLMELINDLPEEVNLCSFPKYNYSPIVNCLKWDWLFFSDFVTN